MALHYYEKAEQAFRDRGQMANAFKAVTRQGEAYRLLHQTRKSAERLDTAKTLRRFADPSGIGQYYQVRTWLNFDRDRFDKGLFYAKRRLAFTEPTNKRRLADANADVGQALLSLGDLEQGSIHASRAKLLAEDLGDPYRRISFLSLDVLVNRLNHIQNPELVTYIKANGTPQARRRLDTALRAELGHSAQF
jgi:tetratricopeptide (TPR) repeat protein